MDPIGQELISQLEEIEGNGAFVTSGQSEFVLPGLSVEGVGEISFPLAPFQLKSIIEVAKKAPFGKGSKTITDTSVRSAWEIDADQLTFHNKKWQSKLKKVLADIKNGLGLENEDVDYSLYKMLIYEEGDFFLPHKDSEKEPGMFGTLIVGLPSKHAGGELIVQFDGKEEIVDFSDEVNQYLIPYVAFYADCEHEVKPITSGYRVCLVYNLVQGSQTSDLSLSGLTGHIQKLSEQLEFWKKRDDSFPKAILLGHEYTPANFSRQALKQHDRPRAESLFAAVEQAGYFACLGLVTHYQMGDLDVEMEDDYGYGRNRSYDQEGSMGEIHESYTTIEHWAEDTGPSLGNLRLPETDILTQIEIGKGEPTEQEEDRYTGNAGMTMMYWYHYGAIILWPDSQHTEILGQQELDIQLSWLKYYVENWENTQLNAPSYARQSILNLSDRDWENKRYLGLDFSYLSDSLIQLKDEALLIADGLPTLLVVFQQINIQSWISLLNSFGPGHFKPLFLAIGNSSDVFMLNHLLKILAASTTGTVAPPFVLEQLESLPGYLSLSQLHKLTDSSGMSYYYSANTPKRKTIIFELVFQVLSLSKWKDTDEGWIAEMLTSLTVELPRKYVNEILSKVLLKHPWKSGQLYKSLYKVCKKSLEERVVKEPQPLPDWRRSVPKPRNEVWKMLSEFLNSPTSQVFEYKKGQAYRDKVANVIRNTKIDLKMETIRKGSPHTLRIIKTQAAYEKKYKNWEKEVALLNELKAISQG